MTPTPKIWVTRPRHDGAETAAKLAALGFDPIIAPLLEMQVLPASLPKAQNFAAIALTSANALTALEGQNILATITHLPVFCVGARTALAAQDLGFTNVLNANGALSDLADLIIKTPIEGPIFYPSGKHVTGDLAGALAPHNRLVITCEVYEMATVTSLPPQIISALNDNSLKAVSLYSRRTAEAFCDLTKTKTQSAAELNTKMHALRALCLSENVAMPLLQNHFTRIALADYPSEEAMMALALDVLRSHIEP